MDDYAKLIEFLSRAIADVESSRYRRVDDTIGAYIASVYRVANMVRVDIKSTSTAPVASSTLDACADLTTATDPPW